MCIQHNNYASKTPHFVGERKSTEAKTFCKDGKV